MEREREREEIKVIICNTVLFLLSLFWFQKENFGHFWIILSSSWLFWFFF